MKNEKELKRIGKYMSLLLRHAPTKENLDMDVYGYVHVEQLLRRLKITKEELDWIVGNNNKKRFAYNEKETKIKASQGHSFDVLHEMDEVTDKEVLYHGTIQKHLKAIQEKGLLKMRRQHVHMSGDKNTAVDVGNRHVRNFRDKLLLLVIDVKKMRENGLKVYISDNGVYLTDHVPPEYIKITFEDHKF